MKDWNELDIDNPLAVRCTFAAAAGGTEALWSVLEPLRWGRGDEGDAEEETTEGDLR